MPGTVNEAKVVFAEELLRSVRQVPYVLVTLSIPVILLLVFVGVTVFRALPDEPVQERPDLTGIVNLSPDLRLPAESITGVVTISTREEAVRELLDGSVSEVYVIPEDYVQTGSIERLAVDQAPTRASAARVAGLLRLSLAGQALPSDVLNRALTPAAFERTTVDDRGEPAGNGGGLKPGRFLLGFGGSIMLMFALVMGGGALLKSVAEEKENRMIEVLLTSARPISIMAGKVLAVGLASLVQVAIWMGSFLIVAPRILDVFPDTAAFDLEPALAAGLLLFFLGGYFLGAALLAAIGAISSGVNQANQLSAFVTIPLAFPFWFMWSIIQSPEGALSTAMSLFPLTAAVGMPLRIALGEPPLAHVLLSGAGLIAAGALSTWLSARVFRAGLLMYGQRMSPGRMWTALRQAGS